MQNTYLSAHVVSQSYVYFRIQCFFSMNNWTKIKWFFKDFFHFYKFQELFLTFNDFSMILKQIHYKDVIMSVIASQITSPTIVYSTVYSGTYQRKHQSPTSLAFVQGIHQGLVNSLHKWPVTRKMFPFHDVIMWISMIFQEVCGPCANALGLRLPCTHPSIPSCQQYQASTHLSLQTKTKQKISPFPPIHEETWSGSGPRCPRSSHAGWTAWCSEVGEGAPCRPGCSEIENK